MSRLPPRNHASQLYPMMRATSEYPPSPLLKSYLHALTDHLRIAAWKANNRCGWNFFSIVDIRIKDLAMEASSSSDSLFDGMPDHFPDSMPSSDEVTNLSHKPHIPTFIIVLPRISKTSDLEPSRG